VAACGSPPPKRPVDDPKPATGLPACIPAGDYTVAFDLSAATITPTGTMSMGFCKPMAEQVPNAQLTKMKLYFADGRARADWPRPIDLEQEHECEVDVSSGPVHAHLVFERGVGRGTADYTIGAVNNPAERGDTCEVLGAKLTVTRTP
jgi:hypothetical protein